MMRPQQKMSDAAASFLRCSKLAGHPRDAAAWRAMCEYANSALVPPSSGLADLHVILAQAVMGDDAALDVRARQMEDLARERRYPSGSYFPGMSRFTAYNAGISPRRSRCLPHWPGKASALAAAERSTT